MKELLFYIINDLGQSFVKQGNNVILVNDYKPLGASPIGWDGTALGWERDATPGMHGVLRNFGQGYSFPGDSATILRAVFYPGKIESPVFLLIQKRSVSLTDTHLDDSHKTVYKGLFDFSTFNDNRQENKISISIGDKGFSKLFQAKRDTVLQLPISTDNEAIYLRLDGVAMKSTYNLTVLPTDEESGFGGIAPFGTHLVGVSVYTEEKTPVGVTFAESVMYKPHTEPVDLQTSTDFLFELSEAKNSGRIKGEVSISAGLPGNYSLQFKTNKGQVLTIVTQAALTGGDNPRTVIPFDFPFSGSVGERFFLFGVWSGSNGVALHESKFEISFFIQAKTTYVACYTPFTLLRRLITKATDRESYVAYSEFLEAHKGLLITSGDALRRFADAVLKTSLSSYLKSMHVLTGACAEIRKDQLNVTTYAGVYNFDNAIQLGTVGKPIPSYAKELVPGVIKVGYPESSTNDVNGKLAVHNTASYSTPMDSAGGKELSLISDYKADIYEIEKLRNNYEGKTTTDANTDNDVYIIDSEEASFAFGGSITFYAFEDGKFALGISGVHEDINTLPAGMKIMISGTAGNNRSFTVASVSALPFMSFVFVNETVTAEVAPSATLSASYRVPRRTGGIHAGTPTPTTFYNKEITPARLIQKHMAYISSLMWEYAGSRLKFNTADKNQAFVSETDGITVTENADIIIGSERLFIPVFVNFETLVPVGIQDILEERPSSAFEFVADGVNLKGLLFKAAVNLATGAKQDFRVLLAPDTDTLKLIK